MNAAFFVTGTDTDVGKTIVAASLVLAMDAHYWKPVQTGAVENTDFDFVRKIAGVQEHRIVPSAHCFRAPLSPHLAAALENESIALGDFVLPSVRPLIVEGAGGVFVPLNDDDLMVNLMQQLNLPAIVVARSGLGTINQTLLTLGALRAHGVPICGVVMNGPTNEDNRKAIEHFGKVTVLGMVPVLKNVNEVSLQAVGGVLLKNIVEVL